MNTNVNRDEGTRLIVRLSALLPMLANGRETHVEWRDWLLQDPAHEAQNPLAGDADFHAQMVVEYDERLACVEAALTFVRRVIVNLA